MRFFRRTLALALALMTALSLCGCGGSKQSRTYYTYFDTVSNISGYCSDADFEAVCALAEDILPRYHRAADIYHEYAGEANACTLNAAAGQGPVTVSAELIELLEFGKLMYEETGGMCNIAMGSVFALWHESRETALGGGPAVLPDEAALLDAARHCRIENVVIDSANSTVELTDPDMRIDLGAIAKGYAAEQLARAIEDAGYTHIALNLGGNVRTIGEKNRGSDWVAGIVDPDNPESGYLRRVSVTDTALVTSGSYQRFFDLDGVRYHHIISPETLYPNNKFVSVTVRARDSALSDALSTALFNMEWEDGYNYVNLKDGVEACWVFANGDIKYSQGFRQYVLED